MLIGSHDLGAFKALTVTGGAGGAGDGSSVYLIMISIGANEIEVLDRRDVERLRDLCNEALS